MKDVEHMEKRNKWPFPLLIGLGWLLMAVACTQSALVDLDNVDDGDGGKDEDWSVDIDVSVGGMASKAMIDDMDGTGVFLEGDVIGFSAYREGEEAPLADNQRYSLMNSKWGPEAGSGVDSLYWEVIGRDKKVVFSATYPQETISGLPTAHSFSVQADQSTVEAYIKSDFLQGNVTSQDELVDLVLKHRMSRILFHVMSDSITSVKLQHLHKSCEINTLTGTVVSTNPPADNTIDATIVPLKYSDSGMFPSGVKSIFAAVMPPQELTNTALSNLMIATVETLNGQTLVIPAPLEIKSAAGTMVPFDRLVQSEQLVLQIWLANEGVVIAGASIEPWGIGGTTSEDTHQQPGIYTASDLIQLAADWNDNGELSEWNKERFCTATDGGRIFFRKDITFTPEECLAFEPIGNAAHPFTYYIDGKDHMIRQLNLSRGGGLNGEGDYTGLFGILSGSLRNLHMENCNVFGSNYVGALAALANGAVIEACSVQNSTVEGRLKVGALTGASEETHIKKCNVDKVTVKGLQQVGGLIGYLRTASELAAKATLTNARVTQVTVIAIETEEHRSLGCLVGEVANGVVANSFATGTVSGYRRLGGLVGTLSAGLIRNCYVAGKLKLGGAATFTESGILLGAIGGTSVLEDCFYIQTKEINPIPVGTKIDKWSGSYKRVYPVDRITGKFDKEKPMPESVPIPTEDELYPLVLWKALNHNRGKEYGDGENGISHTSIWEEWTEVWMRYPLQSTDAVTEGALPDFKYKYNDK